MTTNQTIDGVPRELLESLAKALMVFTGHDSGPNLRHNYGDEWWKPLDAMREELRAMLVKQSPCAKSQVEGRREKFQKWVMATKHPVYGFLDGRSLARGDDRTGYADEYVQGLWVAYLAFGVEHPQVEPVARITLQQVLKAYDYANCHPHKYLRGTTNWCAAVAYSLNAEQPAPVAVVLPERKKWDGLRATACNLKGEAWNACLDEVARLNTKE